MRILKQYDSCTNHQKSDDSEPKMEIVFFDEMNFGWVVDSEMLLKTQTTRTLEDKTRAMTLYDEMINKNKEIF